MSTSKNPSTHKSKDSMTVLCGLPSSFKQTNNPDAVDCRNCLSIMSRQEAKKEKPFSVFLVANGNNRIAVIKTIREFTRLGLKDAKDLSDAALQRETLIKICRDDAETRAFALELTKAGATVRVGSETFPPASENEPPAFSRTFGSDPGNAPDKGTVTGSIPFDYKDLSRPMMKGEYLAEVVNINPDWKILRTPTDAEKELDGFSWRGPGWYLNDNDSLLVLPSPLSGEYWFLVYNGRSPFKGINQLARAPVRVDDRGEVSKLELIRPDDALIKLKDQLVEAIYLMVTDYVWSEDRKQDIAKAIEPLLREEV